jgi:Ca2+-binding RTX toxin-like protein
VWGTDYTDSITVATADGTEKVITVTMHGTNDLVVASLPTTYAGTGDTNDFDSLGLPGGQTINDGNANITRYGGADNDTINGQNGGDLLYGGSDDDTLTGGQGTDAIYGGSGTDTITGNNAPDNIYGGFGADIIDLNGDGAADTIYYIDLRDTGDTINNFVSGEDKINLSAIDSGDIDHAFDWGGQQTGQYAQAHSVTWFQSGSNVVVLADTDGNLTTAEFSMTLTGISSLNQNDFLL